MLGSEKTFEVRLLLAGTPPAGQRSGQVPGTFVILEEEPGA